MRNKISSAEYLAFISAKHQLDPDMFFQALISARKEGKSSCGRLAIQNRANPKGKTVFLITIGPKVVAQFPVSDEFLLESRNPIKSFRNTGFLCRRKIPENNASVSRQVCIRDLKTGMKQVSLKAKVLKITKPVNVFTRFGNCASVASALIEDDTGTIKLCLWNEQIDTVSVGNTIRIENASTATFKGERQLRIGKKGMIVSLEE